MWPFQPIRKLKFERRVTYEIGSSVWPVGLKGLGDLPAPAHTHSHTHAHFCRPPPAPPPTHAPTKKVFEITIRCLKSNNSMIPDNENPLELLDSSVFVLIWLDVMMIRGTRRQRTSFDIGLDRSGEAAKKAWAIFSEGPYRSFHLTELVNSSQNLLLIVATLK